MNHNKSKLPKTWLYTNTEFRPDKEEPEEAKGEMRTESLRIHWQILKLYQQLQAPQLLKKNQPTGLECWLPGSSNF